MIELLLVSSHIEHPLYFVTGHMHRLRTKVRLGSPAPRSPTRNGRTSLRINFAARQNSLERRYPDNAIVFINDALIRYSP